MGKRAKASDTADAVIYYGDDRQWHGTCALCPRTLQKGWDFKPGAYLGMVEHLATSHGLNRIWIEVMREGYRAVVQDALPLIVAHDLQTIDHVRPL